MQFHRRYLAGTALAAMAIACAGLMPINAARAAKLTTVYLFSGGKKDGGNPTSGLSTDGAGNYFGTTYNGGSKACGGKGCGTVYTLSAAGQETVLYAFKGGSDGANSGPAVIRDDAGNLYGTTLFGGNTGCNAPSGCGTVYKIAPDGTETQLYAFAGPEGAVPYAPLTTDDAGNLYGTTAGGGGGSCSGGCGTIFKISTSGKFSVLHTFTGGGDGGVSVTALQRDSAGIFFGVASAGGTTGDACAAGCGTVFSLSPKGRFKSIYKFQGGSDGYFPTARLQIDSTGALYGATYYGGDFTACATGCGTVYKVSPRGRKTILYSFSGPGDGSVPASIVLDGSGNLFGTTIGGGDVTKCGGAGCGTVFEISGGTESTVHTFLDGKDGAVSYSPLAIDANGNMFGTAEFDGGKNQACQYTTTYTGCGVIYRVSP